MIKTHTGIYFGGGGFKTLFYFGIAKFLIENNNFPKYFEGKSAGGYAAAIAAALSTIPNEDRTFFLDYAIKIFENEIVKKTSNINKNWLKCQEASKQTIIICKKIQPDIKKYDNILSIYITHVKTWTLYKKTNWSSWEELEQDLRAGSSIPFIQDYKLINDSNNKLSIDSCFIKTEKIPDDYIYASCNFNTKADIYPRYNIPKWYNIIVNPAIVKMQDWYNDAYLSSFIFYNLKNN